MFDRISDLWKTYGVDRMNKIIKIAILSLLGVPIYIEIFSYLKIFVNDVIALLISIYVTTFLMTFLGGILK